MPTRPPDHKHQFKLVRNPAPSLYHDYVCSVCMMPCSIGKRLMTASLLKNPYYIAQAYSGMVPNRKLRRSHA